MPVIQAQVQNQQINNVLCTLGMRPSEGSLQTLSDSPAPDALTAAMGHFGSR
ncbi:hypothetical protein BaRGS_00003884, partial [Batillaria attramentaria]